MHISQETRRRHRDDGFTLVEMMVVVMILAILIALGLPSYQGFKRGAWNAAAQASLNTAEKVAAVILLDEGQFPSTAQLLIRLPAQEPSITWLDHNVSSTGPGAVSIDEDAGGDELSMATLSASGTCFYQRLERTGPTVKHHVDDAATCNAHTFQDGAGAGW